jgi:hypothetical protein
MVYCGCMILADFPHKHLIARHEHIGERLLDVRDGVVLVETGYDASPLLEAISKGADLLRGDRFRNRGMCISFKDGNVHANEPAGINSRDSTPDFYSIVTEQFERIIGARALDKIARVGGNLVRQVLSGIDPDSAVDDFGNTVHINVANRVRGGNIGHVDYATAITVWFGATHQGLRINQCGDWIYVPDEAINHTVDYRGRNARVSAIAF